MNASEAASRSPIADTEKSPNAIGSRGHVSVYLQPGGQPVPIRQAPHPPFSFEIRFKTKKKF
jgi:hypothetical protein